MASFSAVTGNHFHSPTLREAELMAWENSRCEKVFPAHLKVTHQMMCASTPEGKGGTDACKVDLSVLEVAEKAIIAYKSLFP